MAKQQDESAKRGGCGKVAGIAVIVLAGVWVLGGIAQRFDDAETAGKLASEPAVQATVAEILTAYSANELAAKDRFDGKVLEVRGKAGMIIEGFGGKPIIALESADGSGTINAGLLPDERSRASALTKGQDVTVRCARITASLTDPTLLDCRLPVAANQFM
ncbi:MAG: hypothetical protein Q8R81_09570 [Novosphingobium sp.]|uniref:OB-fold protein n=1 Tax=Novosphingobium sp. TaxID=1874826 RepID=UPI00273774B9|nr:hypothetical protein [Novosphingobium sp.]MDP3550633.1 hypothetical protein [Novosphingobium sp.]